MQFEKKQKRIYGFFTIIFCLSILLDIFNSLLTEFIGFNTSSLTFCVYLLLLIWMVYVLYKNGISQNILLYFCLLLFYGVDFIFFSSTRSYFLKMDMLMIYGFFLPICFLIIPKIYDWDKFIRRLGKISIIFILLFFIVIVVGANKYLNYMEVSYSLLPFICICIYMYSEYNKVIYLLFYLLGIVLMIVFGSRAPVFFSLCCLLVFFIDKKLTKQKLIIVGLAASLVTFFITCKDYLFTQLSRLYANTNSYFLDNLLRGDLFKSSTRDDLEIRILDGIKDMGLNIYGLFGDRQFAFPDPYAHNIIYEILLSFGWFIGISLILIFIYLVISTFIKANSRNKKIIIILFFSFFARYFVSGSFVQEYQFYFFIAMLMSIRKEGRLNAKIN